MFVWICISTCVKKFRDLKILAPLTNGLWALENICQIVWAMTDIPHISSRIWNQINLTDFWSILMFSYQLETQYIAEIVVQQMMRSIFTWLKWVFFLHFAPFWVFFVLFAVNYKNSGFRCGMSAMTFFPRIFCENC